MPEYKVGDIIKCPALHSPGPDEIIAMDGTKTKFTVRRENGDIYYIHRGIAEHYHSVTKQEKAKQ